MRMGDRKIAVGYREMIARIRSAVLAGVFLAGTVAYAAHGTPNRAQPVAARPMRVALLLDTSEAAAPAISAIRSGAVAFIDALPAEDEIVLVSTGRRVQVRVQPTTDRKKLAAAANGLLSDGGPTPLADALLEVDERFMKKAEHPAYVIVTGDGPDSSIRTDDKTFNSFLQRLREEQTPAHAVVLKYKGNGMAEAIASLVVRASGGRLESMSDGKALSEKMKALAELIAAAQ
jgi:Mg-chelatase subunit ChlD